MPEEEKRFELTEGYPKHRKRDQEEIGARPKNPPPSPHPKGMAQLNVVDQINIDQIIGLKTQDHQNNIFEKRIELWSNSYCIALKSNAISPKHTASEAVDSFDKFFGIKSDNTGEN